MVPLLPADWLDQDAAALGKLSPLQWLNWPPVTDRGLHLAIKREDLLHPQWGGNKVYKLHGHIRAARAGGYRHLLSFGGPWSNHIHALAAAGYDLGLRTTGVIRGERPPVLSDMLRDAQTFGMQLRFVSRADYARKEDPRYLDALQQELGAFYMIPEGGGGAAGLAGCFSFGQALGELVGDQSFDVVCLAVGTGTTFAGVAAGLPLNVTLCGFSVLRGEDRLTGQVRQQVQQLPVSGARWRIETGYHCGGYARVTDELALFMQEFEEVTGVPLDPVYTAKMMWGITQRAVAGQWPRGSRILAIHSGGLQGRRGFPFLRDL